MLANLGDSGFRILRDGACAFASEVRQGRRTHRLWLLPSNVLCLVFLCTDYVHKGSTYAVLCRSNICQQNRLVSMLLMS